MLSLLGVKAQFLSQYFYIEKNKKFVKAFLIKISMLDYDCWKDFLRP